MIAKMQIFLRSTDDIVQIVSLGNHKKSISKGYQIKKNKVKRAAVLNGEREYIPIFLSSVF